MSNSSNGGGGLTNWQLENYLSKDSVCKTQLVGVFAADEIEFDITRRPALLILNSDDSGKPGKHWCAIYVPQLGPPEFFDSAANLPQSYNITFQDFLVQQGPEYKIITARLQQEQSTTCGHFCLYYAWHRARGWTLEDIIDDMDLKKLANNDYKVVKFVKDVFNVT